MNLLIRVSEMCLILSIFISCNFVATDSYKEAYVCLLIGIIVKMVIYEIEDHWELW